MGDVAGRKGASPRRVMSRSTLMLGAWLCAALALAPLLIFLVMTAGSHGGVGVPLSPAGLNHELTQWASGFGNELANRIGCG